jgi:hypothetical protein
LISICFCCCSFQGTSQTGLLAESLIWEYVVQISSFIRTLHGVSLACRCLHLSRILVDGDSRTGRAKSRYIKIEKREVQKFRYDFIALVYPLSLLITKGHII